MEVHLFFKSGKRELGELELSRSGLTLRCPEAEELQGPESSISWDQVRLSLGGAANRLIFFHPDGHSTLESFYVQKSGPVLEELKKYDQEQVQSFLAANKKHRVLTGTSIFTTLGSIFAIGFLLYYFSSPIIGYLATYVPYSAEQKVGEKVLGLVLPPNKQLTNPEVLEPLREQVRLLIPAMPEHMREVGIYIAKDEQINAFALPGGNIVFNTGMLKKARNIEEVLGVAAHELAHVQKRHVIKGILQTLGVYFLFDMLIGDYSGMIAVLAGNSEMLLQRGFSRSQEAEADRVGFEMLKQLEMDPVGMVHFFETIVEEQKEMQNTELGQVQQYLSFLSTHPDTEERIQAILAWREKEINADRLAKVQFDYEAFRAKLKDL